MTERTFTYQPKYEFFFARAFGDFSTQISIIAFLLFNIIFIVYPANWAFTVSFDLFMISIYSRIPLRFVYYVSDLKLINDTKTIEYTICKFDKVINKLSFQINDIEVKIGEHWFQRHTTYDLKIYYKKKCIIKQTETENWTKEMFDEIKKQIQILKTENK